MRLRGRRRSVAVRRFDAAAGQWRDVDAAGVVDRDEVTVATYNIWYDNYHREARYRAIADLLSERMPDVIVLQEVTPSALEIFLAQPWVRDEYLHAAVVGGDVDPYGMLMLSRLPISHATYTRLPTRQSRGFLEASLNTDGTVVCCLHLDSGKKSKRLRGWQLRRIFRALRKTEAAVLLGDYNMRDAENHRISDSYCDVWPTLRPNEDGFTEDTAINLMRLDARNKTRQVRFDRVLVKGTRWRATAIELLGTEPISEDLPRVFPSDHFGVTCRINRR